ncbi:hypothetical protein AMATHDRAFT_2471 [Amanita thiersii Skay4041]|uniref:DBF4-type domain-containing protein n=1 Tax=Amanita thiersii Skay4041 TaxID=703135 RepID=A0A2A9NWA8_9AGAR|nr:hypothetical protein AMATHDRAFT_2471 [Amanita thiersii Skay4041]
MAFSLRRPLSYRPSQPVDSTSSKRARSPDPDDSVTAVQKRVRASPTIPSPVTHDRSLRQATRERRLAERELQKAEFRDKYRRAFPSWIFYFDLDHIDHDRASIPSFEARIQELEGTIEDFFSNQITHLITNQPVPTEEADKENIPKLKNSTPRSALLLKSPVNKPKGRPQDDPPLAAGFDVVAKALSFGIKVWSTSKLDSVLNRCLDIPENSSLIKTSSANQSLNVNNAQRSLTRLLRSERIHGISERDPTQKRHDFRYFSRSSYFILVEDLRQELATIAAHEYEIPKSRDVNPKMPWPVLHCHPWARGPFIPFDEKEKRRWEKQQAAEKERENEVATNNSKIQRLQAIKRKTQNRIHNQRTCNLRKSVSVGNLQRRASYPLPQPYEGLCPDADGDIDHVESNNASGYLASGIGTGYVAASGNSLSATSLATTSNAGYTSRSVHLSSALSGRIRQQVVTSRKVAVLTEKNSTTGSMGPPKCLPERQPILRKSKSTNTLRLPKREEGSKPGYCESCRMKFDNFKAHTTSRRHQKYAMDDANFLQLDYVLARVQRRTLQQVETEQEIRCKQRQVFCERELKQRETLHNHVLSPIVI